MPNLTNTSNAPDKSMIVNLETALALCAIGLVIECEYCKGCGEFKKHYHAKTPDQWAAIVRMVNRLERRDAFKDKV